MSSKRDSIPSMPAPQNGKVIGLMNATRCNSYRVSYRIVILLLVGCCVCNCQQNHNILKKLRQNYPDFIPEVILDIGANKGVFAKTVRNVFPNSKLLMFEASSFHDEALQDFVVNDNGKSERYIGVLSGTDGDKVSFFDLNGSTGNSMFRENTKHFTNLKPMEKITSKVDTIVSKSPLAQNSRIDLIKADVQGAELIVFEGATKALEQATFVQFEASTIVFNEGGACFFEIDEMLRSHGFYLYEIADLLYNDVFKTKGMGQFDVLYVKPTSPRLPAWLKNSKPKFCGATSVVQQPEPNLKGREERKLIEVPQQGGFNWYLGFLSGVVASVLVQIWVGRKPRMLHKE